MASEMITVDVHSFYAELRRYGSWHTAYINRVCELMAVRPEQIDKVIKATEAAGYFAPHGKLNTAKYFQDKLDGTVPDIRVTVLQYSDVDRAYRMADLHTVDKRKAENKLERRVK